MPRFVSVYWQSIGLPPSKSLDLPFGFGQSLYCSRSVGISARVTWFLVLELIREVPGRRELMLNNEGKEVNDAPRADRWKGL